MIQEPTVQYVIDTTFCNNKKKCHIVFQDFGKKISLTKSWITESWNVMKIKSCTPCEKRCSQNGLKTNQTLSKTWPSPISILGRPYKRFVFTIQKSCSQNGLTKFFSGTSQSKSTESKIGKWSNKKIRI